MFINIVFWLGCHGPSGLLIFVPAVFLSILKPLFLHSSSVSLSFFILYSCFSHAHVFGKTLVHEFPISYSHTESYTSLFHETWSFRSKSHRSKTNYIQFLLLLRANVWGKYLCMSSPFPIAKFNGTGFYSLWSKRKYICPSATNIGIWACCILPGGSGWIICVGKSFLTFFINFFEDHFIAFYSQLL